MRFSKQILLILIILGVSPINNICDILTHHVIKTTISTSDKESKEEKNSIESEISKDLKIVTIEPIIFLVSNDWPHIIIFDINIKNLISRNIDTPPPDSALI